MEFNSFEHLPEGESLRHLVSQEIMRNSLLKDENIFVGVEGDEVILSGTVDSLDKKWLAEDIAGDVFGVLHVRNGIHVSGSEGHPSDDYRGDFYENI